MKASKPDEFEVVFVSSDRDEGSFSEYYGEMPWLVLPFADRARKAALSGKYKVQGIPTLVLVNQAGEVITTKGTEGLRGDKSGAGSLPIHPVIGGRTAVALVVPHVCAGIRSTWSLFRGVFVPCSLPLGSQAVDDCPVSCQVRVERRPSVRGGGPQQGLHPCAVCNAEVCSVPLVPPQDGTKSFDAGCITGVFRFALLSLRRSRPFVSQFESWYAARKDSLPVNAVFVSVERDAAGIAASSRGVDFPVLAASETATVAALVGELELETVPTLTLIDKTSKVLRRDVVPYLDSDADGFPWAPKPVEVRPSADCAAAAAAFGLMRQARIAFCGGLLSLLARSALTTLPMLFVAAAVPRRVGRD